jgi:hypothetical protein
MTNSPWLYSGRLGFMPFASAVSIIDGKYSPFREAQAGIHFLLIPAVPLPLQ